MSDIQERQMEQDQLNQMFIDGASTSVDQSDQELMAELEQLAESEAGSTG